MKEIESDIKEISSFIEERNKIIRGVNISILLFLALMGITLISNISYKNILVIPCIIAIVLFLMIKDSNKKEIQTFSKILEKIKKLTGSKN